MLATSSPSDGPYLQQQTESAAMFQQHRSTSYLLAGERYARHSGTCLYSVHLCHWHDMFPHASLWRSVLCQSKINVSFLLLNIYISQSIFTTQCTITVQYYCYGLISCQLHAGIVLKWLNTSSSNQYQTAAKYLQYSQTNDFSNRKYRSQIHAAYEKLQFQSSLKLCPSYAELPLLQADQNVSQIE